MGATKSREELIKDFWRAPGINIQNLLPGTTVIIETTASIIELVILDYEHVEMSGTDPRFHKPVVGRFIQSVYDVEGTMKFPGRIAQNLRIDVEFANATFRSTPAVSAGVRGKGFKYDVF